MKLNSIRTKLALTVGGCCFIIIGLLVAYNTITSRKEAIKSAREHALAVAKEYSGHIKAEIEVALNSARTLAQAFSAVKNPDSPLDIGRDPADAILETLLIENKSFFATYMLWEPEAFDQLDILYKGLEGHDDTGRFIPYWSRDSHGAPILGPLVGYETEGIGDYYQIPRKTMNEAVIDPHIRPVHGKEVAIISLVAPIIYKAKFYGIVGVDMSLDQLQEKVHREKLYGGKAQIFIISNDGTIAAASHQRALMGKSMRKTHPEDFLGDLLKIKNGREVIEVQLDMLEVFTPLKIGNTGTPWSVNVMIPLELITAEATSQMWKQLSIGITLAGFAVLIIILFTKKFIGPLRHISEAAQNVALGDLEYKEIRTADDEVGKMNTGFRNVVNSLREITSVCEGIAVGDFSKSVEIRSEYDVLGKAINQMAENLRGVVKQAGAIAEGNYSIQVQPRSEHDELGNALQKMTKSLRKASEENERSSWFKTGQAELNDRMRREQDIAALCRNIITFLSEYLNAQIGAIYLSGDNNHLRLAGSYAFKKRKNLSNEFELGEGLVGQAALEKESILLTNVPEDYIAVSSGLGEAVPRNILMLPFLHDEGLKGVVELGTFDEFSEKHLDFLNQVAENIAIGVHSVQSRQQVQKLLEQKQTQAEKLQAQQEELRQTNEELEEQTKALKESEERLQVQQEELRQTNEELEEQTQRLEEQRENTEKRNKELKAAQKTIEEKAKQLELSSKYKSEFLANMSHELRTPLNSILLLSRLLADDKDGRLTEGQVESAQTIYSSGSELLALINEILDLSKVEAGKMELHVEDVNLKDFAEFMERAFQPLAGDKGLSLKVKIAKGLADSIRTDRQRTEQILKNFLSNALKFTTEGGISLSISRPDGHPEEETFLSQNGFDPKRTVSFSVTDTGIGIAEDKQNLIFEAFQQSDGTTSRKYGGTGLGLSIAKELAKFLGGQLRLKSREGKGSTFTLYLPEELEVGREQSAESRSQRAKSESSDGMPPVPLPMRDEATDSQQATGIETIEDDRKDISPGDKSILIIEDDSKFSKILRDLSRDYGFKCLVAGDGETGLQFADYYKPSAIILDIGLPRLDGWAVMTRLKENPGTRHIPVHFISALDKRLDAMKMGAVDYLTKPVTPEALEQVYGKIESIISKKVKDLLIVEDNRDQAKAIVKLIGNGDVRVTVASTAQEAYDHVLSGKFDCMVLDLGLPDMSGQELLVKLRNDEEAPQLPIIIYTGRDLTEQERATIDRLAESTIIKGATSRERLLDETTLFLHRVEADLPEEQQGMLRMIHDKDMILADKKVLIVDDDMRNVFSLKKVLEGKSVRVLAAGNGKKGLECLNSNPDIHLVLIDIMMPEMNGYEAMKEIRKQERFKDLPIIALTAKAMRGDRSKCIEAGASDYLAKPVDVERLFSMLRVWLY